MRDTWYPMYFSRRILPQGSIQPSARKMAHSHGTFTEARNQHLENTSTRKKASLRKKQSQTSSPSRAQNLGFLGLGPLSTGMGHGRRTKDDCHHGDRGCFCPNVEATAEGPRAKAHGYCNFHTLGKIHVSFSFKQGNKLDLARKFVCNQKGPHSRHSQT